MRFNDQAHLDLYTKEGKFPWIHDNVAFLIKEHASDFESCMDLGCSLGLLSVRAVTELGRSECAALDSIIAANCIKHPLVSYRGFTINRDKFKSMEYLLKRYKPTLVICRRILPEIGASDPTIVTELFDLFHAFGVKWVVGEARVNQPAATNPIKNLEMELALIKGYSHVEIRGNAYCLKVDETI